MVSKNTYLTGLKYAVLFSLIAQCLLSLFFNSLTPDIFKAVVTHDYLRGCAWIKSIYPGYLEHPFLYIGLLVLVSVYTIVTAAAQLDPVRRLRLFMAEEASFSRQLGAALSLAAGTLFFTLVAMPAAVFAEFVSSSLRSEYFLGQTSYLLTVFFFTGTLILLGLQGRAVAEGNSAGSWNHWRLSLSATTIVSLLFCFCHCALLSLFTGTGIKGYLIDILSYAAVYISPTTIAAVFTAFMEAGGFITGLVISIASVNHGLETQDRVREIIVGAVLLIIACGGLGIFSHRVLKEKLHFFTGFNRVVTLAAEEGPPRQAIIFNEGAGPQVIDMTLGRTLYTPGNEASLRQYLARYGDRTLFSDRILSRLIDFALLNWDMPAAMDLQKRKIEARYDNILDIIVMYGSLCSALPHSNLVPYAEYLTGSSSFAFPGAVSCGRAALLLEHFGLSDQAEGFFNRSARKKKEPGIEKKYREAKKIEADSTSVITGQVLHHGSPLPGVKVRIFPVTERQKTEAEKKAYIEGLLAYEKAHGSKGEAFFMGSQMPAFRIMRTLFAVSRTDATGRFSFSHLAPGEYRMVLLIERSLPVEVTSENPGSIRITEHFSSICIPAVELR